MLLRSMRNRQGVRETRAATAAGLEVLLSVFTNPATGAAEHAAAYVPAVLGLLGGRVPITVLRETPSALPRVIEALSPGQLRQAERPGKWSIGQILHHLADSELVWAWRMRLIIAHERPPLTGYDQDLWADRLQYDQGDPREALAVFAVLRQANRRLVERATPADLRRVGVHAERGDESLEHQVRLYAGHDLLHLRQIDRVRSSLG
jgi:DinB superfamily